jgi:hypothetical protein
MAETITDVAFEGYVFRPQNRHNTTDLKLKRDVDSIEAGPYGVTVSRLENGTTFRALYPWAKVKCIRYANEGPMVVEETAEETQAAPTTAPKGKRKVKADDDDVELGLA